MGRVTKNLLLPRFSKVDMVEPSKVQLDKAREYVESANVEGYFTFVDLFLDTIKWVFRNSSLNTNTMLSGCSGYFAT